MNRLLLPALLFALAPAAGHAAPAPAAATRDKAPAEKGGGFFAALLPKSLQKNPKLDFNILTEMTPEGRRLKPPTAQNPVYYISQSGGVRHAGLNPEHDLKGPTEENLQRMVERALAEGHYHPSTNAAQPPTLVIIYHFGSHSFQPPASVASESPRAAEEEAQTGTGDVPVPEIVIRKALLDKAQLLGGAKFLKEVVDALGELDRIAGMERSHVTVAGGESTGSVASMMRDPFDTLRARSTEHERMVDELFSSSFFVIASAYDYAALVKKERRLLWRTKMTVNSLGVNMVESIPPLIASAAPYLGRETREPVLVTKRITRDGNVNVGTPVVVEADAKLPEQPPAKKK